MKKFLWIFLSTLCITLLALTLMGASGSSVFSTGTVALSNDLALIPTGATALSSYDTYVYQIVINNPTGAAETVYVRDAALPFNFHLINALIPAGSTYVITFPEGQKMKDGMVWYASGSGLIGAVRARRI